MPSIGSLFETMRAVPDGFLHQPEFLTTMEERALLDEIEALPFGPVIMRGVTARRRVLQYGSNYRLDRTPLPNGGALPEFLLRVRERVGELARVAPDAFSEALVTEYPPGAPIGWHRDAPPFGIVAGISLLSSCRFKLREIANPRHVIAMELAPRSAYVMKDAARSDWQHSIPAVKTLRYSITFRTLRRSAPSA